MKMNIFKKLPQIAVKALAASALLLATALGSVAMTAGVAGAAPVLNTTPTTIVITQTSATSVVVSWSETTAGQAAVTATLVDSTTGAISTCSVPGSYAGVETCAISGLTNGDTYSYSITDGTTTVSTALSSSITFVNGNKTSVLTATTTYLIKLQTPIGAPIAYRNGQSDVTHDQIWVSFNTDGVGTLYTATGSTGLITSEVTASAAIALGANASFTTSINTGLSILPGETVAITAVTATISSAKIVSYNSVTGATILSFTSSAAVSSALTIIYAPTCTVATAALAGVSGCELTGLLDGSTGTISVAPNAQDVATTATYALDAVTGTSTISPLNQLDVTATTTGAGNVVAKFATDGVANFYQVTLGITTGQSVAQAASFCNVSQASPSIALATCSLPGLSTSAGITLVVTPTGGGTLTGAGTSALLPLTTALAKPVASVGAVSATGTYPITVSFTADGVATKYTVTATAVSGALPSPSTCVVANTATALTGTQSCTILGFPTSGQFTFTVAATLPTTDPSTPSSASLPVTTSNVFAPNFAGLGAYGIANAGINPLTGAALGTVNVSFIADGVATKYVLGAWLTDSTQATGYAATTTSTCTLSYTTAPTGALTCAITGLASGKTYTLSITPSGGTIAQPETKTTYISPAPMITVPGASNTSLSVANGIPTAAVNGDIQVVSWTADGIATQYSVSVVSGALVSPATGTCYVANTVTPPTGAQSCTIKGLTTGVPYVYQILATNNAGSTTSTYSTSTAKSATNSLGSVTVTSGGSGTAVVSWTADNAATAYNVADLGGTKTCLAASATALTGVQTCTVSGLINGTQHLFTVTPINGVAAASTSVLPFTVGVSPLSAPVLSWGSGTSAGGTLTATFTADGVANSYTVIFFSLTGSAGTCQVGNSVTAPTGTLSCTSSALTLGATYVAIVSPSGNGTTSATSAASTIPVQVTNYSAPGAPAVTATALTSTTVSVAWTAPVVTGGSIIAGYLISALSSDGLSAGTCGQSAVAGTMVCSNLKPGTTYKVSVYAAGPFGASAAGTASVTTPAAVLAAETGVTFNRGTATLTASAKAALTSLASSLHDGASITVRGWGQTKAIATARANAVASFLLNAGAAVHTTIVGIVVKTATNAKVYQTA